MVLEEETKIVQSRNAHTQYIIIPAAMVLDSQYFFKSGDKIRITIDPYHKMMIITPIEASIIEISPKGIFVKGKRIEVVEK